MKGVLLLIVTVLSITLWAGQTDTEIIPDFTLENAAGQEVSLYNTLNDSTVVIVDFWATWCGPCCQELPHLNELHNKYPNVEVLAITTDGRRTSNKAKKYVQDKGYSFNTLMDSRRQVQKLLKVEAIPVTFIIKPDGSIFYKHVGYKAGDEVELEEKLTELLTELKL